MGRSPPTIEVKEVKEVNKEEYEIRYLSFEVTGKPIGNSCHILIPKSLRGKRLKVSIEVLNK
jgi:putative transposon-encoded protein